MLRQHVKFSVKMILRQRIKPYTDSKTIIQDMKKNALYWKCRVLRNILQFFVFKLRKNNSKWDTLKNIFTI